jgi:hypothetical protein
MSVTGALIKGGLSLLGGLLGRKKKRGVDYVALRDSAQRAGFNPLTVLNASGGQGFETGGELTGVGFAANALKQGFDTWYNAQSEQKDRELADLQKKIMEAELEEIQKSQALPRAGQTFGFDIPHITTYADVITREKPILTGVGDKSPLTFGQQAESPIVYELESDAYKNAVKGQFWPWVNELVDRNVPMGHDTWREFFWGKDGVGFLGNEALRSGVKQGWETLTDDPLDTKNKRKVYPLDSDMLPP